MIDVPSSVLDRPSDDDRRYNHFRLPLIRCLLQMVYVVEGLTVLRVWHVRRLLGPILQTLERPFRLVDMGCGLADHLFFYASRYRGARFTGVDHIATNVVVCRAYQRLLGLDNLTFAHADLCSLIGHGDADVVLCLTALQYVADPDDALRNIRSHLKPDGVFVLYQDVNDSAGRGLWGIGAWSAREQVRQYRTTDVIDSLRRTGFGIERVEYCEGVLARHAEALLRAALSATKRNAFVGGLFLLSVALCLPLYLLALWIDFLLPHQRGAALLLIARKSWRADRAEA